MSAITDRFQQLHTQQSKALIPYITAGDPDLETTFKALQVLDRNGADIIELGVPYSDPLADGPVIQAAVTRSLAKGTRLERILEGLSGLSLVAPIVIFSYYNPIYQMGISRFVQRIRKAGCSGVVVPDLPAEEAQPLVDAARAQDLSVILLVAPTSTSERMQLISQLSSGFVYLVSTTGVTGQRESLAEQIPTLIQTLRQHTTLPIGVGFGISNPQQARQVVQWGADAAIVGSAFVRRLGDAATPDEGLEAVGDFCRELKGALS